METEMQQTEDAVTLQLRGHLDKELRSYLKNTASKAPRTKSWHVDLGNAESITSDAVASLLELAHTVKQAGGTFELENAPAQIARTLDIYRFDSLARNPSPITPPRVGFFEAVGEKAEYGFHALTGIAVLLYDAAYWTVVAPLRGKGFKGATTLREIKRHGFDAVPVIALVAFLFGVVLAVNGGYLLEQWGQTQFIADMVGVSLAREVGPMLAAVILASRSGAAISAEIGTMQVREEIDAMWVMGINPAKFLITPKIIALALAVPVLSLTAHIAGMIGAFAVSTMMYNVPPTLFLNRLAGAIAAPDIFGGLGKGVIFGIVIGLVGCWYGFAVRGSAEEVGTSTTGAVVSSIVLVIVLNGVFSFFLYGVFA